MAETYSPPTGAEIAAHIEAGGTVDHWLPARALWDPTAYSSRFWRDRCRRDVPHPGYRLAPIPPRTERVPCWIAVRDERAVVSLPGRAWCVMRVSEVGAVVTGGMAKWVPVAEDGTVECLVEDQR